ncbi:hypothetical protein L873DRAFT_1789500 [Choiromyces venosus 120613-1]|uniref:Uncharacterized protein n=1 Tax=Choiromyces venosus 120613-1 TaxID=1336337 RepID=A0A3N4JQM1_9PEZI|nr:hypothetical protein L873DRAFT_1789500 [Choiromyces venosus 120613-1]
MSSISVWQRFETTISSSSVMSDQQQNRFTPTRYHSQHSIWTEDENEQLIQWLEDPVNLQKTKKGSRMSKKMIITKIAIQIPTKPVVKVSYKYDNLIKSYKAAAKLNDQSG